MQRIDATFIQKIFTNSDTDIQTNLCLGRPHCYLVHVVRQGLPCNGYSLWNPSVKKLNRAINPGALWLSDAVEV
jgi:hypothetical protein